MRLLITGAAGFIGASVAKLAVESGHLVTVLDDFSTGYRSNLNGIEVRLVEGSLADRDAVDAATDRANAVVHLCTLGSAPRRILDPVSTHFINATGTLTLLESARAAIVGHLSCASSVYGLNPALPEHEREWVRPLSPCAVTKLAAEQYTLAYQQSYGLNTLAFRFFNVYGPLQTAGHVYAAARPGFLDALLKDTPLPVNGDGSHSRDFTRVGTVCRVLLAAAEQGITEPEPVNLAFDTNTTLLELVTKLEHSANLAAHVVHREPRPGDVKPSQADNAPPTSGTWMHHPLPIKRDPSPAFDLIGLMRWMLLLHRVRPNNIVAGTPKAGLLATLASATVDVPSRVNLQSVDLPDASEIAVPLTRKRIDLGLQDRLTIDYVGPLHPDKEMHTLVNAFAMLAQELDARLLLIGPQEPSGYFGQCIKHLSKPLRDRITWSGAVTEPAAYYRAMDVLCLPSNREGFPNPILEAGDPSVSVVASAVTVCIDAVMSNETGVLFVAGGRDALATELKLLLQGPPKSAAMTIRARANVQKNFAGKGVWAATKDFYLCQLGPTNNEERSA